MTRFGRGVLLVGTPLVMLAVIGAVYFQIYTSSHSTRQVTVVSAGTSFALFSANPISGKRFGRG